MSEGKLITIITNYQRATMSHETNQPTKIHMKDNQSLISVFPSLWVCQCPKDRTGSRGNFLHK